MNFGMAVMAIIAAAVFATSCSTQSRSLFADETYTTETAS